MIGLRFAVIFITSVIAGVAVGWLTKADGKSIYAAVIAGGAAFGATFWFMDRVVGD
ncbi:hypothetical protein [Streptomyces sp. NPDC056464]|uniref:hypothetical protein n=1 Tax=Streptomyces sp. NPDC056464 TaxID=3345828 RepID=UPI00368C045A